MGLILVANGLRSGYATGDVLQGVGVEVASGEIVGVLGRNGVGKSTLIRTLIGLLPVRAGQIRFKGQDITTASADSRARRGIGYVPQGREIFPHLSVMDNLRMGRFVNREGGRFELEEVLGWFPFLRERLRQRGGTLSGGQQEMLAIARALINGPDLMLLDEPSDGVQPSIVQEIGDFLAASGAPQAHRRAASRAEHRPDADRGSPCLCHGQGSCGRRHHPRRAAGHRARRRVSRSLREVRP